MPVGEWGVAADRVPIQKGLERSPTSALVGRCRRSGQQRTPCVRSCSAPSVYSSYRVFAHRSILRASAANRRSGSRTAPSSQGANIPLKPQRNIATLCARRITSAHCFSRTQGNDHHPRLFRCLPTTRSADLITSDHPVHIGDSSCLRHLPLQTQHPSRCPNPRTQPAGWCWPA